MSLSRPSAISLLLALALWAPAAAHAENAPWSPASVHAARERELSRALEAELEAIPGLREVRVEVDLPRALDQPVDAPPNAPRVVFWLTAEPTFSGSDALASELRALAQRDVPGARASDVTLHLRQAATESAPAFRRVGPFRVQPASEGPLRAVLLALLAATFVLSALLIRTLRRGR